METKPQKISVLISSKKDSRYLAKFLFALFCRTSDIANVEVLVMLNKNDKWNRELQAFFMAFGLHIKGAIQFFEEDHNLGRAGLHVYFNELAERATGDWLVYFCDDHHILAKGWDQSIRDFAKEREMDPKKINFIIAKFDNVGAMNHIVSFGAYNAMGQLAQHGWIDSYLNSIIKALENTGRVGLMDDELFHDFSHDPDNPMVRADDQANIKGTKGAELPDYKSIKVRKLIDADSAKLKDLIDREVL